MSGRRGLARRALAAFALSGALPSAGALAQSSGGHAVHQDATAPGAPSAMTDAVVRRGDREAGKITLKREPIANLDMTAMTMAFRVSDPAMLDRVKPGDAVRFTAESIGGALTVTRVEPAD